MRLEALKPMLARPVRELPADGYLSTSPGGMAFAALPRAMAATSGWGVATVAASTAISPT